MTNHAAPPTSATSIEAVLRDELARGDVLADSVPPILRQLIGVGDVSLFSEEILTRVRAMLSDLAVELLNALIGPHSRRAHSADEVAVVGRALLDNSALLTHLHALALEWQLTERMEANQALDPVMSPFLLAQVATGNGAATAFLASQARWCQAQRRMKLPLLELPADLLNVALYTLTMLAGAEPELADRAATVESDIRRAYDTRATRLGLAADLASGLGDALHAVLSLSQGGVALFLTALAQRCGHERDSLALSTHETQRVRLALAMRMAGLTPRDIETQLANCHAVATLPAGFDLLGPQEAAALLSRRTGHAAG